MTVLPPPDKQDVLTISGQRLTQRAVTRGLRCNIVAGSLGMVWVAAAMGMTTTLFMERLGASGLLIGMVVTVQQLAMAVQIPAALYAERLPSRKPFWAVINIPQRLLWFLPAALAMAASPGQSWLPGAIIGIVAVSSVMTYTASAGWFSWMADLVPARRRNRFWAIRQSFTMLAYLIAVAATGWVLDRFNPAGGSGGPLLGFAIVYGVGAIAGTADIVVHLWVPEPQPGTPVPGLPVLKRLAAPFHDSDFTWLTLAYSVWAFSLGVVGSFGIVYLRREFGVTYTQLSATMVAASLATVISGLLWGSVMDAIGARAFGAIMMLIAPVFQLVWFVMSHNSYAFELPVFGLVLVPQPIFLLVAVNLVAGAFYSGASLTQFNLISALFPRDGRTVAMAVHWTVVGGIAALGPVVGGIVMDRFSPAALAIALPTGISFSFYHVLACVHAVLVWLVAVPLLVRVRKREGDASVRLLVGNPLRAVGAIHNMVAVAGSTSRHVRADAVRKLARHRTALSIDELLKKLDDPSAEVREESAIALGKVGEPRAIAALVQRLEDPDSELAPQIARALRYSTAPETVDALVRLLDSHDRETQVESARALGEIGNPKATSRLLELLQSTGDPKVASASAEALSRLGEQAAIYEILPRMKGARNPVLRRSLAVAVGDLLCDDHSFYTLLVCETEAPMSEVPKRLERLRKALRGLASPTAESGLLDSDDACLALEDAYERDAYVEAAGVLYDIATRVTQSIDQEEIPFTIGGWYLDLLHYHWDEAHLGALERTDILLGVHALAGITASALAPATVIRGQQE